MFATPLELKNETLQTSKKGLRSWIYLSFGSPNGRISWERMSNPWKIAHRQMRLGSTQVDKPTSWHLVAIKTKNPSKKCWKNWDFLPIFGGESRDQWLSRCCYWGPRFSHWLRLLLIKLHIGYSPICKRCEPSYGKPKNKDPLLDSLYNSFLVIYGYWVDHMGFFLPSFTSLCMVCKCLFKHRTTGYGTHQPMVLPADLQDKGIVLRLKKVDTDAVRIMKNNKMKKHTSYIVRWDTISTIQIHANTVMCFYLLI